MVGFKTKGKFTVQNFIEYQYINILFTLINTIDTLKTGKKGIPYFLQNTSRGGDNFQKRGFN